MSSDFLCEVLLVGEVAQMWCVNHRTVWHHLDRGNFRWRYSESGPALIDRQSVVRYWGDPKVSNCPEIFEVRNKSEGL